jgi:hypothetical protein
VPVCRRSARKGRDYRRVAERDHGGLAEGERQLHTAGTERAAPLTQ